MQRAVWRNVGDKSREVSTETEVFGMKSAKGDDRLAKEMGKNDGPRYGGREFSRA